MFSTLVGGATPLFSRPTRPILLLALVALITTLLYISGPPISGYHTITGHDSPGCRASDTLNRTLGFEKIYVVSLPSRTDHRDAITLSAALTDLEFDWIDGVHGEDVVEKAIPPGGGEKRGKPGLGSWRAHMNALQTVVKEGRSSALILEDDADWDIRIKEQMRDFALAARTLTQPLLRYPSDYADPTFPVVQDPEFQPFAIPFEDLPRTVPPVNSPYGDNWDVLWIGHCGMRRPQVNLVPLWKSKAEHLSKGFVVHSNDMTVPETQNIHVYDDPAHPRFREDFANHTRVIHHPMEAICCLGYVVSLAGARKLLYYMSIRAMDNFLDIMLRNFCELEDSVCLTVQPSIFNHHRPAGPVSHDSDNVNHGSKVRAKALTENVKWSTRLNIPKLLKGDTDYDDQYPDGTKVDLEFW